MSRIATGTPSVPLRPNGVYTLFSSDQGYSNRHVELLKGGIVDEKEE